MDKQRGQTADAPAISTSSFPRSVHSSQPNVGRRASCNPTFVTPTKHIKRGTSLRAANGKTFGKQHQQNGQQEKKQRPCPDAKKKEQATSFANEAFARKDAMKAFAAKKLAAQRGASERAGETPEERMSRKLTAQKAFARRQGLELHRKNDKRNSTKSVATPTLGSATSSDNDMQKHLDKENLPKLFHETSSVASSIPEPSLPTTVSNPTVNSLASASQSPSDSTSATISNNSERDTTPYTPISPSDDTLKQSLSSVTDLDDTPAKSSFAIVANPSVTIPPGSPGRSVISRVSTASTTTNELSRVPTCDVHIIAASRISVASSSGPPVHQPVISTSNGKWCPNCAGVGLHISALLTDLAKQPRAENAQRPTTGAGASGSLGSSWKRRMSQTIIGDRGASKAVAEQKRLQQQIDVLTTTVAFLYEKLQAADIADQYVDDAFNRCRIAR